MRPFREQVAAITEDDVWRRKALVFVEAQLHALTGDLPALQAASDAIAKLAARFEGWRPWLCWSRAALHRLRGELEAADAELRAALALVRAGEHRAWIAAAPAHAELQLLRGDTAAALDACAVISQAVGAQSLDRSAAVAADRICALALSQRGEHAAAAEMLARAFELAETLGYDGLPLAQLHEAQARISLASGTLDACTAALRELWSLLEHADAPALWNAYEALLADSARHPSDNLPAARPAGTDTFTSAASFSAIETRLQSLNERADRAQQALSLLLAECAASTGHLLLFGAEGLFAAASTGALPDRRLIAAAQRVLPADQFDPATEIVAPSSAHATGPLTVSDGHVRFVPIPITDPIEDGLMLSGVALLALDDQPLPAPRAALVQAIGRCLRAAGDSQSRLLAS